MNKELVAGCCAVVLMLGLFHVTPASAADDGRRLGPCDGIRVKTMLGRRFHTINDAMQSWIGSTASEVVGQWGAPTSSFENRDGTRILSWRDEWSGCVKSFGAGTDDVISKWGANKSCTCRSTSGRLPNSAPVPEMTL